MGKGVLEGVLGGGKEPRFIEELCALEAPETSQERTPLLADAE